MRVGVPGVQSVLGVFAAAACGLALLLSLIYAPPALPRDELPTFDQVVTGGMPDITSVEIAPMVNGSQTPGEWQGVPNGPFNGILSHSGIIPGVTVPGQLTGRPGVIETIDESSVVNPPGKGQRVTLGWFVRTRGLVQEIPMTNVTFVLMSYDYVLVDGVPQVAFEVFVFQLPGGILYTPQPDGLPPWVAGVAVNADGQTLSEVPLTIADRHNYQGASVPVGTPVKPGVDRSGVGCRACHERTDEFTGRTGGFPWRERLIEETPKVNLAPGGASCPPGSSGAETPSGGSPGSSAPGPAAPATPAPGGTSNEHGSAGQRPLLGGVLCRLDVRTLGPAKPGKEDDEDEDRDPDDRD